MAGTADLDKELLAHQTQAHAQARGVDAPDWRGNTADQLANETMGLWDITPPPELHKTRKVAVLNFWGLVGPCLDEHSATSFRFVENTPVVTQETHSSKRAQR
eukprot:581550-Amphidinium_carterae.1